MRTLLPFMVVTAFCISCKTPRVVEHKNFTTEPGRVVPYDDVLPKKEKAQHLALLLPDNPDSLNLAQSELARMLVRNGFRVIIPGKPGNNVFEKTELDNKSYRVQDINNLLRSIDTTGIRDYVIIGIGEGGYLVPDISYTLSPKISIVVNAGPQSMLDEYENLVSGKVEDQRFLNSVLAANLLFNKDELADQIARIKENPYGEPQLFGGSNAYWISYKEDPMMNRIIKPSANKVWMISNDYPLISAKNKDLVRQIASSLSYIFYKPLEGRGNFNDEEEMKLLIESIEEVINNPPQSY